MKDAVGLLTALAQDSRLAIFRLLMSSPPEGLTVGEIGARLGLAPATQSFHLKELSRAGLLRARPEGRFIFYSADVQAMARLIRFLSEDCCAGQPCELSAHGASGQGGGGPSTITNREKSPL